MAALFQVAGSSLPQVYGWGVSIGERSRALDTAIVPAGWAFSIWGIIFLWTIIFAVRAAMSSPERAALANKVAAPAAIAFLANGVWGIYTPLYGFNIGSQIIIVIGLAAALSAAIAAGRFIPRTVGDRLFVAAPLGLLAGWLTAASFVGGSSVLQGAGIEMTTILLLVILAAATIFALVILVSGVSPTYGAAIVWALSAVIDKNRDGGVEMIVYAAAAALVIVLLVTLFRTRRSVGRLA